MYDIIVIGAGPAGLTAALYARRAEKSVLVLERDTFGGQITHSPRVENYPGFLAMSGNEFAEKLIDQVLEQGGEIDLDEVMGIEGTAGSYTVLGQDKKYYARAVIIATGSHHRQLGVEGENRFVGEGISYCAVCDGAFYKGKTVAVIGGGNSALQDAVLLSEVCPKVYVVQNLAYLTGEKSLVGILEKREGVEFIYSSTVEEILGDESFRGIKIKNAQSGEVRTLELDGMFVAIGQVPANGPFKDAVSLNDYGYVIADESCVPTAAGSFDTRGVFVAGDCRSKAVRQVTTATADGAVSALAAIRFLDSL